MTHKDLDHQRLASLDLRSTRIAFAVFESVTLLDAGVTRFDTSRVARSRLELLIRRFGIRTLVLRTLPKTSRRNCKGTRAVLRIVRSVAQRLSVRIALISEKRIRVRFSKEGATTRYQIALSLVRAFPTLASRLPPPRKLWRGDHHNMGIFDAVALGFTYVDKDRTGSHRKSMQEFFRRSLGDE